MTHETTNDAIKRRRFSVQFRKVMKQEKNWRDSKKILNFLRKLGQPTSISAIRIGIRGFNERRIKRLLAFLILHKQVGKFKRAKQYRYGALGCAG